MKTLTKTQIEGLALEIRQRLDAFAVAIQRVESNRGAALEIAEVTARRESNRQEALKAVTFLQAKGY